MALCGVGVGAEKNQFCTVIAQDNRVTGQVNVNQTGKGDDVFAEHIRLRFTGRQKNLVMAGFQGAQQRLAGKIKRRANLAGFQDIADAVLKPGAIPVQLIFERLLKENLLQLFDGLVTEKILFRFTAFAFVAVSDVRIKVCLVAGLAVTVDPCQSFNLASQQVNFLEVPAGFLRFDDELGQPRFQTHFDTADGGNAVPAVALFPALHRRAFHLQHGGNLRHGKSLPVQQRRLTTRVV
ncbi:Uncharacterised protein [Escherichia coli]|nr:Uncharacterised protein [Escherichia coli]